jgi:hypothetical protein
MLSKVKRIFGQGCRGEIKEIHIKLGESPGTKAMSYIKKLDDTGFRDAVIGSAKISFIQGDIFEKKK